MDVSLFGLGHVGCVTAACLAREGHTVWGVDVNADKVAMINAGESPIVEAGLAELIREQQQRGALWATIDPVEAVRNTEVSLLCVGTPSNGNGSVDLQAIKEVADQIGGALRDKSAHHCVIFRSTVLPGTVRNVLIPTLAAAAQKTIHRDIDVCFNPEFLREGSAVRDFYRPPFTVIGHETRHGRDIAARLYDGVDAPIQGTSYEVAEMMKYVCNSFHALKVSFANEIGTLCKALGIDGQEVMDLFVRDTKLNISASYLKPGFAFGGSCLGKDLRALIHKAKELDVESPLLRAVLDSNDRHVERVIDRVLSTKHKRVGFLGLSFKSGTDDLRDSPTVRLVETMIGKGRQVKIYDPEVSWAKIFGANKHFIEHEIPHISTLLCASIDEVLTESDVIVVSKHGEDIRRALGPNLARKPTFDLIRVFSNRSGEPAGYDGICW